MPINTDVVQFLTIVNVCRPGGGKDIYLDGPDEVVAYIRDPDGYAALHFGLTKLQYLEWIQLDGAALCCARVKTGDLCRNFVGGGQLRAPVWLAKHRKLKCRAHRAGSRSK